MFQTSLLWFSAREEKIPGSRIRTLFVDVVIVCIRPKQVENAKAEIAKPFAREAELEEKCKRLSELNAELNMDRRENEIVDGAEEQSEDERDENSRIRSDRNDR